MTSQTIHRAKTKGAWIDAGRRFDGAYDDAEKTCLCDGTAGRHIFRADGCNFGPAQLRSRTHAFR